MGLVCRAHREAERPVRQRVVAAADFDEHAPEALADDAVDDEVDRRVDRQQHVREGVDVAERLDGDVGDLEVSRGHHEPQQQVGDLADEEDDDDGDEHQREVLVARRGRRRRLLHVPVLTADGSERADEARVEHDEGDERPEGAEHQVEEGLVDDEVRLIVAEPRLARPQHHAAAVARATLIDDALEETRHVVEDGGRGEDDDGAASALRTAQMTLERPADGDVAVERHEDDHPDGGGLRRRRHHPNVGLGAHHGGGQRRRHGRVGRLQRLDEDARRQVGGVDGRQRLQQPRGRPVAAGVAVQHGDGQRVAEEAKQADGADRVHVDHHLVAEVRRRHGARLRRRALGQHAAGRVVVKHARVVQLHEGVGS